MILVVVESPYAGDVQRNLDYVRLAMADCLKRGEAPFASHALYTQPNVLDDALPDERKLGINAGFEWGKKADKTVVYIDLGVSEGMKSGIQHALLEQRPVEFRSLGLSLASSDEFQTALQYMAQFANAQFANSRP